MLSMLLATALAAAASAPPAEPAPWHDRVEWHGMSANMLHDERMQDTLEWNFGQRVIAPQPLRADTASTLFNGLYAMAQDDLKQDSVSAIRDGAFDHGQPIPCHCFETGLKWPYVWTRDLSYAVDLGLWRFDPARARNGLAFKLSNVRGPAGSDGNDTRKLVMEDTGSGGSWPVSSDRVAWFLAARHLLDDTAFAADVATALRDTLAQDRRYVFDSQMGLYRGETSFLDWREQTYPDWTRDNVVPIAQSFALSTNVLQYQALELAAKRLGESHGAPDYRAQAAALKAAINTHFWRDDRGMYMSYIGGNGAPYDTYDLLGISLAIISGVADGARARQALANYPTWPAGSPVIWPERSDQAIYHNRAVWPFVSAYALRAARVVNDPARISHELRSIMRGAALAGSNMESYELLTAGIHLDEGELSGPVVNSPRQLWSVAGYLSAVTEGVFGVTADGKVEPKLPTDLLPTLFGKRDAISLQLPDREITLELPAEREGNLLVADRTATEGRHTTVTLKAITVQDIPLRTHAPLTADVAPPAPKVSDKGQNWQVTVDGKVVLYVDGKRHGAIDGSAQLPRSDALTCFSATRIDAAGLESLHSPETCVGPIDTVSGDWPRRWTAPRDSRYRVWLNYDNPHGSIQTGVTAAVKRLVVRCEGTPEQSLPMVMPHSVRTQASTYASFEAKAGAACEFAIDDGFNMSYLANFAHFTGGEGGSSGALNQANVHELSIAPVAGDITAP